MEQTLATNLINVGLLEITRFILDFKVFSTRNVLYQYFFIGIQVAQGRVSSNIAYLFTSANKMCEM